MIPRVVTCKTTKSVKFVPNSSFQNTTIVVCMTILFIFDTCHMTIYKIIHTWSSLQNIKTMILAPKWEQPTSGAKVCICRFVVAKTFFPPGQAGRMVFSGGSNIEGPKRGGFPRKLEDKKRKTTFGITKHHVSSFLGGEQSWTPCHSQTQKTKTECGFDLCLIGAEGRSSETAGD